MNFLTMAGTAGGTTEIPNIAITSDMLSPILDSVVSNISVILPIGIGIFAILLGVKLVPKLFSKFAS